MATALAQRLRMRHAAVVMLDGDELREVFAAAAASQQNHGREGRLTLAMQYARLCRVLAMQGFTDVISHSTSRSKISSSI